MKFLTALPCILLSCLLHAQEPAAPPPFPKQGERILFLGDSITMDGRYVAYLDLLLRSRLPDLQLEIIPAGLASETVSGLSEPEHPWPRPSVMERLGRALEKAKPTLVCACYGMNDGIYAPFAPERFAKYQESLKSLIAQARSVGARVAVFTPPPFDAPSFPSPLALQSEGKEIYGFMHPFRNYQEVLARYAEWIMTEPALADAVANLNTPLAAFIDAWRAAHPDFRTGDGVHHHSLLHWLMMREIALAWHIPPDCAHHSIDAAAAEDGSFTATFITPIPLPRDGTTPEGTWDAAGINPAMNRLVLSVAKPLAYVYMLQEGERVLAAVKAEELARGLDLTRYPGLSVNEKARRALELVLKKHQILGPAWREHIGHQRPDTNRQALPLEAALAEGAQLSAQLTELLKPAQLSLKLIPAQAAPPR